jgi:hypothetical protein
MTPSLVCTSQVPAPRLMRSTSVLKRTSSWWWAVYSSRYRIHSSRVGYSPYLRRLALKPG